MHDETTTGPLRSEAMPVIAAGEGWSAVLQDAFPRNPHGIVPVTWALVKAPFATILRLADDPAYRAYWGLLLALTGFTIVALFITLPQAFNLLVGQELISVESNAQRLRLKVQLIQLVSVVIMTPLQYYAFRALSPVARTPRGYVKMAVLENCYNLLIRIMFGLVALVVGLLIFYARLPILPSTVIRIEFAAASLIDIVIAYELHRRYWRLGWWKTLALTMLFVALSLYLVAPALWVMANSLDQLDSQALFRR